MPAARTPAPRGRLAEQAYETIRDQIGWEEIPPGTPLGEIDLATRIGLGRTPVREALQRLEVQGLVLRSGARLIVAPFDLDVAAERLIHLELVEPFVAMESVPRLDAAGLGRLRSALSEMEDAYAQYAQDGADVSARNLNRVHLDFHSILNAECPYPGLMEAVRVAYVGNAALRLIAGCHPDDLQQARIEHRQIVEVAAGVNKGELPVDTVGALVRRHLKSAREALKHFDSDHRLAVDR